MKRMKYKREKKTNTNISIKFKFTLTHSRTFIHLFHCYWVSLWQTGSRPLGGETRTDKRRNGNGTGIGDNGLPKYI